MSVPFLMELRLVQLPLAQLRLLGLAEQHSQLVLPIRHLLGMQLQVHPHRQCVV